LQARTDDISLAFINGFLPRVTSCHLRSRDVTRKSYSDETERIGYRKSMDRQTFARAALNAPSQVFSQCVPLSARRLFSDIPISAKAL